MKASIRNVEKKPQEMSRRRSKVKKSPNIMYRIQKKKRHLQNCNFKNKFIKWQTFWVQDKTNRSNKHNNIQIQWKNYEIVVIIPSSWNFSNIRILSSRLWLPSVSLWRPLAKSLGNLSSLLSRRRSELGIGELNGVSNGVGTVSKTLYLSSSLWRKEPTYYVKLNQTKSHQKYTHHVTTTKSSKH